MSHQQLRHILTFRQPNVCLDARAADVQSIEEGYGSPVIVVGMAGDGLDPNSWVALAAR